MSYLIDANVLIRAYTPITQPPDDLRERELWRQEHPLAWKHWHQRVEAREAIDKLKRQGESLYHTKEIRQEVWKAVQRPETEADGKGLTKEQATALIKEISRQENVKSLEKEIREQLRDKSLAERKEIKEAQRKAEEKALEKAEDTLKEANKKAELSEKALERAKRDLPHVAKAEAHNLKVLTSNTRDFVTHKDIEVRHTRAVALELKPELVKSFDGDHTPNPQGGNKQAREYYKNTKTYQVELASGKTAYLNIKGLEATDNVQDIIYHPDVIKKLEQKGDNPQKPVKIEIKNPSIEITPGSSGGGSPPANNSPSGKRSIKYVVEQKPSALMASKEGLSKAVSEVRRSAVNKTAQVAADASKATLKTAAKIASVPIKAVEKVSEVASQISTTVKMTKIVARGIKEEIRSNFQVHRFEVQLGNKKYEASIRGKTREEAQEKLQIVLQDKKFVRELKAQKEPKLLVVKAEKIVKKEVSRDAEAKKRLARKREQEPPPPPPPKQEQSINR